MATKKKNTKSFAAPKKDEKVVLDGKNKVIGTVIVKPNGVGWKKAKGRKFKFVSWDVLEDLMDGDDRTKSVAQ